MKRLSKTPNKKIRSAANAALFNTRDRRKFLDDAIAKILTLSKALVVSDDATFLPQNKRIGYASAGLERMLIEPNEVAAKLQSLATRLTNGIIVDMRWAISNSDELGSLEQWGSAAEQFSTVFKKPIVSVYDLDLFIEEKMQTALRVHSQLLAASGIYRNPYWMPAKLLETAALDEQLNFMLGRVVPDFEGIQNRTRGGEMLARGATPSWLAKADVGLGSTPTAGRWKIHCFGNLRVLIGGRSINWRIAGSTPKKTQTLFAYLLQCGEKGAHSEQISELLWPEEPRDETKRARLHHTVAMLRKTLGFAQSIIRAGDYYKLNAPPGSWIDINTFEQLCRRGLALSKKGDMESAALVYHAADQLYAGELFENLPREYVESELEDWCLPRRMWLKEMALKLQNDYTSVLMRAGRTREALNHCLKAFALDPASEGAHEVAMQIFAAQGRDEAIHRQFKQYQQAVKALGETESVELRNHYRTLISKEKPKNVV
jgi:DNA-binding SARP family transcriptional activator